MNTLEEVAALRADLIRYVRAKFSSRPGVSGLAEDIVQQAFVEVPEEKWCFPYLSKACLHGAYRCFRRQDDEGRLLSGGEVLWFIDDRDVEEELSAAQDAREILDSLQLLKEIERVVVTQRYYGDYSFAEIARENGIKLNTVLSHHRRALEKLRPRLSCFSEGRSASRIKHPFSARKERSNDMTQHESWEFAILAERAHRLAFDIALQSAQMGAQGHGIAVVADECRTIGLKMKLAASRLLEQPDEQLQIEESVQELELLAVNGAIEMLRIADDEPGTHFRPAAVVFEELRHLTDDVRRFAGGLQARPAWPVASPVSRVIDKRMPFLLMKVAGAEYVENVRMVREVIRYEEGLVCGGDLRLRGQTYRLLHTERLPEGAGRPAYLMLIAESSRQEDEAYALAVDALPEVIWSGVGVAVQSGPYVRECWGCEEGRSMRFLDCGKLL